MKILKTFLMTAAADILSLFIALTLAGSSSGAIRIVSAICTTGVLICILGSFAIKTAKEDMKLRRIKETEVSPTLPLFMGITASLPSFASWMILKFSDMDFYRIHKLVNGYFLQIFNFINSAASSSDLSTDDIWVMLPFSFVPMAIFLLGYYLTHFGIISAENR